jgi:CheY-like chemotaxis protein
MTSTIVIIDDSAELCALLETILPYSGYRALSARTVSDGLALVEESHPDLVIVDFELPDGKGLDVIEALGGWQPPTPSILMTGYGSEGVAARAMRLGALGYLIKPFTVEEVLSTIERALNLGRLKQERAALAARVETYDHHFRAIMALTRGIIAGLDTTTLVERIVKAALFITRAERCFLAVADDPGDELGVIAVAGGPVPSLDRWKADLGDERLHRVLDPGQAVRLSSEPGRSIRLQIEEDSFAVIQAPLQSGERVIGLLSVDRQRREVAFTRHDQDMIQILADHAVLVLEKEKWREAIALPEGEASAQGPNAPLAEGQGPSSGQASSE